MSLKNKNIGIGMTASLCTFEQVFIEIKKLVEAGANVYPFFSEASLTTDSRFGKAKDFYETVTKLTGREPITTIADAEPVGPKAYLDAYAIVPCTGNTLAKLANGITDGPILMAAKAHLRNQKPVIISVSTNDGLGLNLKNIGILLNSKNIYFVPFGQDNPEKKVNSLVSHTGKLLETIEYALEYKQIQPVIVSPH
ncbi:MAG: dipicolinate synthase subunit B [Clostridiales bacterium]|nr:dipicolinate synthase subunit B [Clostridiales bacterium]